MGPADVTYTRPPHIHFEVFGKKSRLVAQTFFPGEALNERDPLFVLSFYSVHAHTLELMDRGGDGPFPTRLTHWRKEQCITARRMALWLLIFASSLRTGVGDGRHRHLAILHQVGDETSRLLLRQRLE